MEGRVKYIGVHYEDKRQEEPNMNKIKEGQKFKGHGKKR